MIWRAAQTSDLEECFRIEQRHLGSELLDDATAMILWKRIMQAHSFTSTVIEDEVDGATTVIAFGASVFCIPDLIDAELRTPRPFLNSRIMHGVHTGKTLIASDTCMTDHSTVLDLVLLAGCFRGDGISASQLQEAQMLLPLAFSELHKGYPIGRILNETVSRQQEDFIASSGIWECVATFPKSARTLTVMTAASVRRMSGTVGTALFQYRAPRLGMRPGERQLLAAAIHGATDHELAAQLHLAADTVKKRWRGIFDQVATAYPALLGDASDTATSSVRGSQKRHRVLAYVRAHPEEVRPFRWYPQA